MPLVAWRPKEFRVSNVMGKKNVADLLQVFLGRFRPRVVEIGKKALLRRLEVLPGLCGAHCHSKVGKVPVIVQRGAEQKMRNRQQRAKRDAVVVVDAVLLAERHKHEG